MNAIRWSALAGFLVLPAVIGCTGRSSSEEIAGVRASFEGYKRAVLDQDGTGALTYVDKNTLDYYGRMLDLALRSDSESVRALRPTDKLMVLMIRHRIPVETVEKMTGETFFSHAVDEGYIGKQSVVSNDLGDVVVEGKIATGVHVAAGKPSPFKWTFRKEGGRWRMDLTSLMPVLDQVMKHVITNSGVSEDEFLTESLESLSGTKVTDEVWEPMLK